MIYVIASIGDEGYDDLIFASSSKEKAEEKLKVLDEEYEFSVKINREFYGRVNDFYKSIEIPKHLSNMDLVRLTLLEDGKSYNETLYCKLQDDNQSQREEAIKARKIALEEETLKIKADMKEKYGRDVDNLYSTQYFLIEVPSDD